MLSKTVPARRRGTMFALSSAFGSVPGLGGARVSRQLLANYAYPRSFAYSFLLCFASLLLSFLFFTLNREPARTPAREPMAARKYWRRLPRVIQRNVNFRRYLCARVLVILGTMGTALYMV